MKVLVPVDGSKHSTESVKVAAHYAKTMNAETVLITVIPYVSDIDLELSASERDRLLESMKRRGEEILKNAVDTLRSLGITRVNTVLATAASPAQEIITVAEKENIGLIIIGSKGRGEAAKFFLGSVAANVIRHSTCCVHVVKEHCWV